MDDVVVIGVGNPERGDDAVGHAVAARLAGELPSAVRLVCCSGADPATLIEEWRGARVAILVDAMVSASEPGTVARFDAIAGPVPAGSRLVSTHALGAQAAVELARALDALPERLIVIAVEGASFAPGAPLDPAVCHGVSDAARAVLDEVALGVV